MDKIEFMYNLQERLANHYSLLYSQSISRENIFDALVVMIGDENKLEWAGDLWDIELSYDKALEKLNAFQFNVLSHSIEVSGNSILNDFLFEKKARFKRKGEIWIIHKYDADPFPSNPHAHQIENNIKLDLSNGNFYRLERLLGVYPKKDLLDIRDRASKVFDGTLPVLEV